MKRLSFILWLCVALFISQSAIAAPNYRVLSLTETEAILEITPEYHLDTISTGDAEFVRVTFPNAIYDQTVGAPLVPKLHLNFLLPSKVSMNAEIIEVLHSGRQNMLLLPVAGPMNFGSTASISYDAGSSSYKSFRNGETISLDAVTRSRTAYSQSVIVSPIEYDAVSGSVRFIEKLKLRVKFYGKAQRVANAQEFTRSELDVFHAAFVNGSQHEFYRSAQAELMRATKLDKATAFKAASQSTGEWLTIETRGEGGVYRITAEDLASAGLSSIDGNSLELFGYGAGMIPESVTDSSGEWRFVPMDVRTDGSGKLIEFYFYARGIFQWKYRDQPDQLQGFYHTINPYNSVGRYMLKVGGERIGSGARIEYREDTLSTQPVNSNRVLTAVVHESERSFEYLNFSREFVGELIPREGAPSLTVDLPSMPAFTPDSTIFRVGFNSKAKTNNTLSVSLNDNDLGTFEGNYNTVEPFLTRSWEGKRKIAASVGTPSRVSLQYRSNDPEARMWLNWIEVFYRANAEVGNTSLPFFLMDTREAFTYSFSNATSGAVWDVTDPFRPVAVGRDNGSGLQATLQGKDAALRQFIAFTPQSALRVGGGKISRTSAPVLRAAIGQQGATNIIIAPEAFRGYAEQLRDLRNRGGEATEAIKTELVILEDIYKEFGYGAKDPVAIRDFMAYVFRHTQRNGTSVPMFLTLFGAGHPDYQNRVSETPQRVPVYEMPHSDYVARSDADKNDPDDGFFVRLVPRTGFSIMNPDLAVGRLSATSEEDAATVVAKLKKYETSSDEGPWRARASMVIDDRIYDKPGKDPLPHLEDSENAIRKISNRMQINKIYGQSYQDVFTSSGRRKPAMETAIIDAFNEGSVITSFVGHGNPKVWTHETVLQVPTTINKFANFNKLTFVTMATCDFAEFDNYADVSGGVLMLTRPAGGAISLLGTSRSVTGNETLYTDYYESLFDVPCESPYGTNHIGTALYVSKQGRLGSNPMYFYLQGDPALRLLVPKQYVVIDSINGLPATEAMSIEALSEVKIVGRISSTCDGASGTDANFNGKATVTLFDSRTKVYRPTAFTGWTLVDSFFVDGPILYRGSATVREGRFTANFIVPRDIKFDSTNAKVSVIAYADNRRSALGAYERIHLAGSDPSKVIDDTTGPDLRVFIGTRAFKSGDVVPTNSTIIVDVKDELGLNTSTASIGHSFIAWVDEATDNSIDMAENYVSEQDNFRVGTAISRMTLPAGRHTLKVRAFDALNNPSFAEVEFVAKTDDPFKLFNATAYPNPMTDRTTVSFMHPLANGNVMDVMLDIFSSDGRNVRTVEMPNVTGNVVEISWDGNDEGGLFASQGAYTYRITVTNQADGRSASAFGTLVLVR
jgi:hypothetical protein